MPVSSFEGDNFKGVVVGLLLLLWLVVVVGDLLVFLAASTDIIVFTNTTPKSIINIGHMTFITSP